jgi:hypothetical protein
MKMLKEKGSTLIEKLLIVAFALAAGSSVVLFLSSQYSASAQTEYDDSMVLDGTWSPDWGDTTSGDGNTSGSGETTTPESPSDGTVGEPTWEGDGLAQEDGYESGAGHGNYQIGDTNPTFTGDDDERTNKEWDYYYEEQPEEYYEFTDGGDGGLAIDSNPNGTPLTGDVFVPEKYNGQFVTKIPNNAFRNDDGLTGISLPGTITEIGVGAFAGAENLALVEFRGEIMARELSLPPQISRIGNHAFGDTKNLEFLFIPGIPDYIGNQAFDDSPNLVLVMEMEYVSTRKGKTTIPGLSSWSNGWYGSLDPDTQIQWGVTYEEFQEMIK